MSHIAKSVTDLRVVILGVHEPSSEVINKKEKVSYVIKGIPENLPDNNLESTAISVLSDIDLPVEPRDIETCHRIDRFTYFFFGIDKYENIFLELVAIKQGLSDNNKLLII